MTGISTESSTVAVDWHALLRKLTRGRDGGVDGDTGAVSDTPLNGKVLEAIDNCLVLLLEYDVYQVGSRTNNCS